MRIKALWGMVGAVAALLAAAPAAPADGRHAKPIDLDVLFVGAHPDDEASGLSTYGQWAEDLGVRAGVITVTRGEGGGNAVGLEEGAALGLLREREERRAVGKAGIRNIYNLDRVDFYYTVSAPLTDEVWGYESTLERVVRVVRMTRPEVVTTMNPSPTPGNHGHHQSAARMAVDAWEAAADPSRFPEQITDEGLEPWRVKRLFRMGADGTGPPGPDCPRTFTPADPSDEVYGVWSGRRSDSGRTWAQIERDAQREYASQGWAGFPDVPTDPAALGCDRLTELASRVPHDPRSTRPDAALRGALVPSRGGLPLGTELELESDRFDVVGGQPFELAVRARGSHRLRDARVRLRLPDGWQGGRAKQLGRLRPDRDREVTFTVTPPADAPANERVRIWAVLKAGRDRGRNSTLVGVAPAVRGTLEPLPQVAQFRDWAEDVGAAQLGNLVQPLLSIGVGETRSVRVDLHNYSGAAQSGEVTLDLPDGFTAHSAAKPFSGLAPGADGSVTFQVTNTDTSLPTANQGPNDGAYPVEVTTVSGLGSSSQSGGLNLVPVTTVPQAGAAPTLDGMESPGEYGATIDLSRLWEGDEPSSPADASGEAKLSWSGDSLYLLVNVNDDVLGTVLEPADAKRHWRTDSVEIALDPRGNAENTSTTFKVGVFPTTTTGEPAAYRDADNRQGPVTETAPGMRVASRVRDPYDGYTLEMEIPLGELPAAARVEGIGLNAFIYDSDTQDKTGQTRLGWSTFGGVQGDPYRWGHARLEGYVPPPGRPTEPVDPVIPSEVARSVLSPQSILQSSLDGVPLGGGSAARRGEGLRLAKRPRLRGSDVVMRMRAGGPGTAHVFVTGPGAEPVLAGRTVDVRRAGRLTVRLPLDADGIEAVRDGGLALASFEARGGGTSAVAAEVR